jgi:hypothetical protein
MSASTSGAALPAQFFAHAKWEGPATTVSGDADLGWKGAFRAGHAPGAAPNPGAAHDPGVIQTSGEVPVDTLLPVLLPNPPVRVGDAGAEHGTTDVAAAA